MAELFQKDVRAINEHLVNIYDEGELTRGATIRSYRIVRIEGSRSVSREIDHYNLEAILAVGFRVRSHRGTQLDRAPGKKGSPDIRVGADPRSSTPSRASSLRSAPSAPLDRACGPWTEGWYDGEKDPPVSVGEDGQNRVARPEPSPPS